MPSAKRQVVVIPLFASLVALFAAVISAQKLPIKTFTTADGLATSIIHSAMRDSDGFLWFTGRGGVSRFDGHEFVSFKLEDQSAPLVHRIVESRDRKRFWIATDAGLYRVDRSTATSAAPSDIKLSDQVRRLSAKKVSNSSFWTLFEQQDGRLLAGSASSLSESGDPNADTLEFQKIGLKEREGILLRFRDIVEDPDGSIWVASDQGIYRRTPDRRWILYSIPRIYGIGNEAGRMTRDPNGNIWVPVRTGVFILHPEALDALLTLPDQHELSPKITEYKLGISGTLPLPQVPGEMVRLIPSAISGDTGGGSAITGSAQSTYAASDGKIWFATKDSIYIVDGQNYKSLRDSALRPGPGVAIAEDLNGNIWFGTPNGLYEFVVGGMTTYDQTSGLIEPNVYTVQELPDGRLLVSHGAWRISTLSDTGFETERLNLPANARIGWTNFPVVTDANGGLWALENFGVYEFKPNANLSALAAQKPFHWDTRSPYRAFNDKQGRLWISGNIEPDNVPLTSINPTTGERIDYSSLEGYPKRRGVGAFAEDSKGRVWLGLYQGGIVVLADGKFTPVASDSGLPSGSIFGLLFDKRGRLWIGSSERGVARVDDPFAEKLEFKYIGEDEGLSSNNVRCLVEDNDGNIYAGTVRGVTRIDGETDEVQVFSTADGLAADFVQFAYRDSKGVMWFGTSNGLSRYEPLHRSTSADREVFISSLQIAGNEYRIDEFGQRAVDGLDMSSSENNIRIAFTSVGEAAKFQYKIEGTTEKDWTAPSSERTLNFANLSPGTYKLLVRTANAPTQQPASVSFTIRPPFWRSWWFLTLAAIFVVGSIVALDRYRVSKTRQVKSALAKSVESETRFRTLAGTASDAIITIEEDSTIVYVNQAVERVFGYKPEEIVGTKLTMLMPERMREGHEAGLARYIQTSARNIPWVGVTLPGLRKDGTEVPLELSFGEFARDGKRFFTGIARDITERLKAEEEIRKAREERMRELQRVRSRIATDLHDDIGSSLTQIAVLSEVARGQASTMHADGITTPLERIKNVSRELVAVMSDIVWAINPQKDYLNDLVQRMRRFGSDVLSGKGIAFEFNAPELEDSMELGANIRREVFAIYKESVNNAAKYSGCSKLTTTFAIRPDSLLMKVQDDGIGFDAAVILSDEFKPEMGGNGLVSIRRRAVELGGVCDIRSAPGKGTEITLTVPIGPRENGSGV